MKRLSFFAIMPRLQQNVRDQVVGMLRAGMGVRQAARVVGTSSSTVSRLINRFQATGTSRDRPRSGHPRVTSRNQDGYIRLIHLRDRFRTAVQTAGETPGRNNPRISEHTVRRRLRDAGLRPYRVCRGLELTPARRAARREWVRQHDGRNWRRAQWRDVIYSDESRFNLFRADGRQRVYRRRGERHSDVCVRQVDRFGGGSVMVWGVIQCSNWCCVFKVGQCI